MSNKEVLQSLESINKQIKKANRHPDDYMFTGGASKEEIFPIVPRPVSEMTPAECLDELTRLAQEDGFYDEPGKAMNEVTQQYGVDVDELDMLRKATGVIPTDEDIEYFYKKLGRMGKSSDAARAKVIKQIQLLEDAAVVYHLPSPPRVKINLLDDRFKNDVPTVGTFPPKATERHD